MTTTFRDDQLERLIDAEAIRQKETLTLIPSENYASRAVRYAVGSVLCNKYSEGYPGRRYYNGNKYIDEIELLAINRAKEVFGVPHANVQPYSGSPANSAVFFALVPPGGTVMGLRLSGGGHLTHGHAKVTFSGSYYRSVQYDVTPEGYLDMDAAAAMAIAERPQIIVVGYTAYPRIIDWESWRHIADSCGAWLLADISHIAGLVAGGVHPSPVAYADVVMTTTHKTLRGPRGALLMTTDKGLSRDPELGTKLDKAVFPGLQGGPHDNTTAGIAVALAEAMTTDFKGYAGTVITNARALSETLTTRGLSLVTGGTDNHLMVVDLRPLFLSGNVVAEALEIVGIVTNRNTVPHDTASPFYPSGLRLGTPAVTTRGMGAKEMTVIGNIIADAVYAVRDYRLPDEKEKRAAFLSELRSELADHPVLAGLSRSVRALADAFPVPD